MGPPPPLTFGRLWKSRVASEGLSRITVADCVLCVESLNVVVTVSELGPYCSPVSPVIIEVDPEGASRDTVTESLLEGTSKTMPL